MEVSIGISNRHVHLKEEDFKILFGSDAKLEKQKDINQPEQYASTLLVTLKTDKDQIENVRILGPIRPYTQIEISKTDAYKLGLNPPVRESGDLKGSSPITLVGPKGELQLEEGCIIANRHIHIMPKQMEMYGLSGLKTVTVLLPGEKGGILYNVQLKVSNQAYYEMHLDTDDANAHLVKNGDFGKIVILNEKK